MIKKFCSLFQLNNEDENMQIQLIHRFEIGLFYFRIFTFLWLFHKLHIFFALSERPKELYFHVSYFGQLFAPTLPSVWLFVSIWTIAFILNLLQLKKTKTTLQIILFLALTWINVIEWSLGYLSHVGHLFLLLHLLITFFQQKSNNNEYVLAIKWVNIGLFSTYSLAGLWKVLTLLKLLLLNNWENSWMLPKAMLYQLITHNRDWDLDMSPIYWIFEIPFLWQIAFILLVLIQFTSVIAGISIKYLPIYVLLIIGMHIFNLVFFQVEFYTPIFVLLSFYFPYYLKEVWVNKFKSILNL